MKIREHTPTGIRLGRSNTFHKSAPGKVVVRWADGSNGEAYIRDLEIQLNSLQWVDFRQALTAREIVKDYTGQYFREAQNPSERAEGLYYA